tara:strand:+ start:27771 stop:28874 length:1104 start_codon:yes stop_codon:yes gene_type:complete
MASTTRIWIDPGVVGGDGLGGDAANAVASWNAAETLYAADITAAGLGVNYEFWFINPTDVDDFTSVSQGAWVVDSTHAVRYLVDPDYQCDGTMETGYRLRAASAYGSILYLSKSYTHISGVCVENTSGLVDYRSGSLAVRCSAGVSIVFSRCRISGTSLTGGQSAGGLYMASGGPDYAIHCIISGVIGVNLSAWLDFHTYLCTVIGESYGYYRQNSNSAPVCTSCVVVAATTPWTGVVGNGWTGTHNSAPTVPDTGYPAAGVSNVQHAGVGTDFEADGFTPTAGSVVLGAGYPSWTSATFTNAHWTMSDGWSVGPNDFHNNVRPYLDDMGIGAIDANSLSAGGFFRRGQAGMNGIGVGGPFFANPLG